MGTNQKKYIRTFGIWIFVLAIMAVLISCPKPPVIPPIEKKLVPPDSTWMVGPALYWTTVDYDSLLKYKVYKGRNPGEYGFPYSVFKPETTVVFDGLVEQITYYVTVSSVDSAESESEKSEELTFIWGDSGPLEYYSAYVTWGMNTEEDLAGYKVYQGRQSGAYSFSTNVGIDTIFCVQLLYNQEYFFAVTAYDTANNESEYSDEVSILITK